MENKLSEFNTYLKYLFFKFIFQFKIFVYLCILNLKIEKL